MIARIARDTAIACAVLALMFAGWKRDWAAPLGVLGGGVLIGLSFWAIRSTVDTLIAVRSGLPRRSDDVTEESGLPRRSGAVASADENGRKSPGFALVKFFTRHVIVALAAYGMMVRLHLDPMGLLAGVSSLGVAAGVEALRELRWRRFL